MEPPISSSATITRLRFTAAGSEDARHGLLGWLSFVLDGRLRLAGIAVRRTLEGRLVLSFPARRDRSGRQRHFIRPLDDAARREIERQVFGQLGLTEAPR